MGRNYRLASVVQISVTEIKEYVTIAFQIK